MSEAEAPYKSMADPGKETDPIVNTEAETGKPNDIYVEGKDDQTDGGCG